MALATVVDLETYMDISFSNRQEEAAQMVLDGLHSELATYLRRPIESTEFTETYRLEDTATGLPSGPMFADWRDTDLGALDRAMNPVYTLRLDHAPVSSVSAVSITPLGGASSALVEETDFVVRAWGIDLYVVHNSGLVSITYTAGLAGDVIPVLKLMILRAAAREAQNFHDDVVGLKDLQTLDVEEQEVGFTEKELAAVKKYRRMRV